MGQYNNLPWNLVTSTTPYTLETWHTAVLIYKDGVARLFLDGVEACSQSLVLEAMGDLSITTVHFGGGRTFKGHLRDLIIGTPT